MRLITQHKFRFIYPLFKNRSFNLLDVGAGSHSATKTKKYFPQCNYYGIDIRRDYDNDESDFKAMAGFYEMDLTQLQFDSIPNDFFDVIIMCHVIEHLHNGDKVLEGLLPKLKKNGYIYIEYPGQKSTRLPHRKGTLNFYDDPTHVRIFSVSELSGILKKNEFDVLKAGTRRYWPYIVFMPLVLIKALLKYKYIPGSVFWDWYGFAEFVFAKKKNRP